MWRKDDGGGPAAAARGLIWDRRCTLWLRITTVVAVAFTFGNALWAAWDQDETYDESHHLAWPRRLLHERNDDRASAGRFNSKTPVLLPAVVTVGVLKRVGVQSEQTLRFFARLTPIFYLALCVILVAILPRPPSPGVTRWLAVLFFSLDPNLAAHASIATSDVAYTLAVLFFAWVVLRAGPSWSSDLLMGAALGFAFTVKYTAVLLVPVALCFVVWRNRSRPYSTLFRGLALTAGAFCVTTSTLYLLVGVWVPLGSVSFKTPLLQGVAHAVPSLPLPFPRSILTGIDSSMYDNRIITWPCYLFGRHHPGGVWYYFLAHWLMKTPASLVVIVCVGVWQMRAGWRSMTLMALAGLFAIHLTYFSFFFATQIGLRFTLPCIALASSIAAYGWAKMAPRGTRWLLPLAVVALAERVPYWGDPIAFTNLTVQPKSRAYWYTAESNLDYGQNRERVARAVKETRFAGSLGQSTVSPGPIMVSANDLTVYGNYKANRWLIDHDVPAVKFGFTHFGFDITDELFDEYMNDTRVTPSLSSFGDVCGGQLARYAPGSRIPFSRTDSPAGGRLWIVCVRSDKGSDVGFRVLEGRLFFGRVVSESSCQVEFLRKNEATWARVPRGGSAQLCLSELPGGRKSYVATGTLRIRGHAADVEFRAVPLDRLAIDHR